MFITLYCAARTLTGVRLTARRVPDLPAYLAGGRAGQAQLKLSHQSLHSTANSIFPQITLRQKAEPPPP